MKESNSNSVDAKKKHVPIGKRISGIASFSLLAAVSYLSSVLRIYYLSILYNKFLQPEFGLPDVSLKKFYIVYFFAYIILWYLFRSIGLPFENIEKKETRNEMIDETVKDMLIDSLIFLVFYVILKYYLF